MKKQKMYLIVACLLAVLSILAIVYKSGGFKKTNQSTSTAFAVEDTTTITRVFMADMFQNEVLLSKTEKGWMVDHVKPASIYKITELLTTLNAIRMAQPVAKAGHQSTIQMLATSATKVEVYAKTPLFKLFGMSFFTKERLIKTYFLGDATQTNLGSFALLEGMSEPYIIYKPGFRGYVTPLFSPNPKDWYSHTIFEIKLTRIQNASFIDLNHPENSFFVEKSGTRTFSVFDGNHNPIQNYDTTLLINMLSEFRQRNYEQILTKVSPSFKDSVFQHLYKIISVTDVNNNITTMKLYNIVEEGTLYQGGELVSDVYQEYSIDRSYATLNDNLDEIYTIQFFHFERQLQPLSYFIKKR